MTPARKSIYRIDAYPVHQESSNTYFPGHKEETILSPLRYFPRCFSFPGQNGELLPTHK